MPKKDKLFEERVAELEQSEAFLKCQIINLKDQLEKANAQVIEKNKQNDELSEHCQKLENCLAVFDAEKSLLDDLKKQTSDMRNKLAEAEQNERILVEKIALLTDEKAFLEEQISLPKSSKEEFKLKEELKEVIEKNLQLNSTCISLKDRCDGLEDLKECLSQQLKTVDEDLNSEISKQAAQIEKLNENLRKVKKERDCLLESKEEFELSQELNLNMTEKLNERIKDLQSHIETLKSQVENQKLKIESFDDVQAQLEEITIQKSTLEALCNQYKSDADDLRKKLMTNQKQMSDSFEKVNQQLIEETDKMAIRQQNLLAENQDLQLRSCSRGFDAVIGKKFQDKTVPLIESCAIALQEAEKLLNPDGSSEIPTCFGGKQDFLNFSLDPSLTENDAVRILNEYGDELIGTTVAEFKLMQEQSPRLNDVSSLSDMITRVIENHKATSALQVLKEKTLLLQNYLEEKQETTDENLLENTSAVKNSPSRDHPSPNMDISFSRITERAQMQERIDSLGEELETTKKVLQLVKEENQHLNKEIENSPDIENLKKELEIFKSNEKNLVEKLNKSQESCDNLIARARSLQEEKFELIKCVTESTDVNEVKEELAKNRNELRRREVENQNLLNDIATLQESFSSLEASSEKQIEALLLDLEKSSTLERDLRKSMKEIEISKENLMGDLQKINEDKLSAEKRHDQEIKEIKMNLDGKNDLIVQLQRNQEQWENCLTTKEDLIQQLNSEKEKKEILEIRIQEQEATKIDLIEENDSLEEEINKVKIQLDLLENEKQTLNQEKSIEIEELKSRILQNEQITSEQNRIISNLKLQAEGSDVVSKREQALTRENEELKSKEEHLLKTTEALKSQVRNFKNDFAEVQREKAKLLGEIEKFRSDLFEQFNLKDDEDLSKLIEQLKKEILDKTKKLEEAHELYLTTKQDLDLTSLDLKDAFEKNLELSTEVSNDKDTINALQREVSQLRRGTVLRTEQEVTKTRLEAPTKAVVDDNLTEAIDEIFIADRNNALEQETKIARQTSMYKDMSSGLKCSRNKCSAELEMSELNHLNVEERLKISRSQKDSYAIASDVNKNDRKQKPMLTEEGNESFSICETSVTTSSGNESSSVETDEVSSKSASSIKQPSGFNVKGSGKQQSILDLVTENRILAEKIADLEITLKSETRKEASSERVSWLEVENKRLLEILKQAEKDVEDAQTERNRVESLIGNLRSKITENENFNLSETESEREAIYQQRRKKESEEKIEIERLKLVLEETDCQIIAQKNKMKHLEERIIDLEQVNRKLKQELQEKERLTNHPLLEKIKKELPKTRLMKTSPAAVETPDQVSPREAWTEGETIPLDQVMNVLYSNIEEMKKIETLTFAQETLDLSQQLEEAKLEINSKKREILELKENDATAKELLHTKEEKIKKLQEQIVSLTCDLDKTRWSMKESKESQSEIDQKQQNELNESQTKLKAVSQESSEKAIESIDLLNQTLMFVSHNEKTEQEVLNKKAEIEVLEIKLEKAQNENEENYNLMKKSNLNKNLNVSNIKLNDRKEEIGQHNSQVQKLEETETPLKPTVDKADDLMAEKEQEHPDQHEQLKDGLNKSKCHREMTGDLLLNKITSLEERNQQLLVEIERLKKKENDVDHQFDNFEFEKALLNTSLESEKEEKSELLARNRYLVDENKDLNEANKKLQTKINHMQKQISDLRNQLDVMAQDTKDKANEVEDLKKVLFRLQKLDVASNEALLSSGRSFDSKNIETLEAELDETSNKVSMMSNLVTNPRMEKNNLESEIQRIQQDYPAVIPSPLPSTVKDVSEQTESDGFLNDFSFGTLTDDDYRDLEKEQAKNLCLQEESATLRTENEVPRLKVATLQENLTAMNERLIPKLELDSLADETQPKQKDAASCDDDTGRYIEDIETTRESGVGIAKVEMLEEKLRMSEDASAKLLLQIKELEEELEMPRENLQELTDENEEEQAKFFGAFSKDHQAQIDQLFNANDTLKKNLERKEIETINLKKQLLESSNTESQWRNRYEEVQNSAEELHQRLQQAEVDNHEMQRRLRNLDQELQNALNQNQSSIVAEIKQDTSETFAQTLSLEEVFRQIKIERKARKKKKVKSLVKGEKEDTDDDVSEIVNSSATSAAALSDVYLNPFDSVSLITNLADDKLLQATILKSRSNTSAETFDIEDIPEPITDSAIVGSSLGAGEKHSTSNLTIKSLQNEIVGLQLIIDELKRRNQELIEGNGMIMTQEEKEALERENSALRGQVALLERNNRIFSDRERNDLKQDLDFANKRCGNLQLQLKQIQASLEYEELEKLKKHLQDAKNLADELREKLQAYKKSSTSEFGEDSSDAELTVDRHNKYGRLLELEEEAEDLKKQVEEQDEDLRDRDVMIEELKHRLVNVKKQYEKEIDDLEQQNKEREKKLQEDVKELEREVDEKKEIIKMKQNNLRNKDEQIDKCEIEIENLEKDVQRKKKEIDQLKWEIVSLQRENATLRERIDRLKHSLSSASDSILVDAGISPVGTFCSPAHDSSPGRGRSRTSSFRSSFYDHDEESRSNSRAVESPIYYLADSDPPHREFSRPRRAYSYNIEDESPTTALREGIHEAKAAVNEMGDVLDTPRMTPRKRSPVPKGGFSLKTLSASVEEGSRKNENKNVKSPEKQKKSKSYRPHDGNSEDTFSNDSADDLSLPVSTSSNSPSAILNQSKISQTSSQSSSKTPVDKHAQISILSLPSKNSTKTSEDSGERDVLRPEEISEHVNNDTTNGIFHQRIPDFDKFSSDDAIKEELVSPRKKSPNSNRLSPAISSSRSSVEQDELENNECEAELSVIENKLKQDFQPEILEKVDETKLKSFPKTNVSFKPEVLQKLTDKSDAATPDHQKTSTAEPISTANVHLLPDDRVTLMQEVTKAREEARKWFTEVTESDREKRQLGRRLETLENEMVRLKDIEDNYELIKKQQDEMKKVTDELENVRSQLEVANRKADEAKERNALLRAHLLDKKEAENENMNQETNAKQVASKHRQKKPNSGLPLSESQERNVTSELQQAPPKLSSDAKLLATEKQLGDIRHSFEYIAANFADLVLKNREAELMLSPTQKKVSKLKRKCLERDHMLAKLLLKARKEKVQEKPLENSFTSSTELDSILTQVDKVIRSDVMESDSSTIYDDSILKQETKSTPTQRRFGKRDSTSTPNSSFSSLIHALSSPSTHASPSPPTHRVYMAKHDYAPSKFIPTSSDSSLPITHSLLPDLPLLSGDTVVAIGNPDQRSDGKLYQMAEVQGKLGFVPFSHLVPAEQVEGMQTFVEERAKMERKKNPSRSPEKIDDLYKKLEQAHVMVTQKLNRNAQNKLRQKQAKSNPDEKKTSLQLPEGRADLKENLPLKVSEAQPFTTKRNILDKNEDYDDISVTSEASSPLTSRTTRSQVDKKEQFVPISAKKKSRKTPVSLDSRFSDDTAHHTLSMASSDFSHDVIRTSTPRDRREPNNYNRSLHHSRSSSLPPRGESFESYKPKSSSPKQYKRAPEQKRRSRSSSRSRSRLNQSDSSYQTNLSSQILPHMSLPEPPTFLVIEKTMGQKSMIICWTPPLLDMISRSNNIPVIGYEISVDKTRKVQVSGAYTNKAILGDLDLKRNLVVEIRTVSSVGTLSAPCEVVYTPNLNQTDSSTPEKHRPSAHSQLSLKHKDKTSKKTTSRYPPSVRRATALYDYDPAVDSPYKSHDDEIALRQGDEVVMLGPPRADGFCDVQVDHKRGIAPAAFLISSCDESIDTSSNRSTKNRKKHLNKRKKANSNSSFSQFSY